jgi:CheY-like chemotaxis protein
MQNEVVLVDDDPVVLMILEKLMMKSHFHPRTKIFRDATEALKYLKDQNNIDTKRLLLLDINMPIINGWELIDALFKLPHPPVFKVVIVTSSCNQNDRMRAQSYGCIVDYIEKPVFMDRLMNLKHNEKLTELFEA